MRRFNSEVGQVVLWDDHEVHDNWYPTRDLTKDTKYTSVKSMPLLAARARQAFLEYNPVPVNADDSEPDLSNGRLRCRRRQSSRSICAATAARTAKTGRPRWPRTRRWRAPLNSSGSRRAWLHHRRRGRSSPVTCPIGVVVPDGQSYFEAFANGEDAGASGRELELANLLKFIKDRRIRERRVDHRGHPLLRRALLPPDAREVHRLRAILGVRRRSAQRRHVRPQQDGRDVRSRGEVHRHPAWHEAESAAERRISVLRTDAHRSPYRRP